MASFNLPNVDGMTSMEELKNAVGKMAKELTWLMQNLDTRNINELHAEKIVAGSIQAEQIAAGAIVAEKIDVDQLSAISADIGEITAGIIRGIEIYGSLISTNETGYPKAEMSITENLFRVAIDANNELIIAASYEGTPAIYFASPSNNFILETNDTRSYIGSLKQLRIESGQDIILEPIVGNVVIANTNKLVFTSGGSFSAILNGIYAELGNLSDRITALEP